MLQVKGLHIAIGTRVLLDGASFLVAPGDKVGLVGRNGAGKSTLMSIVSQEAASAVEYEGTVRFQGSWSYLRQAKLNAGQEDFSALEYVLAGRNLTEAQNRLAKLQLAMEKDPSERNIGRFTRAEENFRLSGGYQAEAEARRICAGLGITGDEMNRPMETLSGGERRRVELAHALFANAETLLLDEPSNHLDVDAKAWLMSFLRSYSGGLLIVSHDLELLDTAITRVLHLDHGTMHTYKGTYSQYRVARAADVERQNKMAAIQEADITRLKTLADRMRHQTASRARVAKSLDKRVERMESTKVARVSKEKTVRFKIPTPPQPGRLVMRAKNLAMSYGDQEVFKKLSFEVTRGDRLLVMGLNGAGKSTLLKILAGVVQPVAGSVSPGMNVSMGYYAQEHEGLRPEAQVIDHLRAEGVLTDQQIRALLGMFTLSGDKAFQAAGTLSGGEKTKLALAQLAAKQHNLLLLDEPTNNLDPISREGITTALQSWEGTMMLVSHDEAFVHQLQPTHVLSMPDGEYSLWSDDLLELVALA
ncbi:MAG TPA: ABC-F family ATP-binding cassette domain-containing protein [Actinomycetota bacterium]|nr:ABC-F family ATP-binding cassette domain-containing protein [Actinomycetota bacterium]